MRRYITYKRVKASDNFYLDPNTNWQFEQATENSKFYETPYQYNWTFLAYVEYPDATTQERIDTLMQSYTSFNFTFITEAGANVFLSQIWDITVANFVFTDNRPKGM